MKRPTTVGGGEKTRNTKTTGVLSRKESPSGAHREEQEAHLPEISGGTRTDPACDHGPHYRVKRSRYCGASGDFRQDRRVGGDA